MSFRIHALFCVRVILGLSAAVPATAAMYEDFEHNSKRTYDYASVELASGLWLFEKALLGNDASDVKNGLQSARLNQGVLTMLFDINGAGEVLLWHANARFLGDGDSSFIVEYSRDQGHTWKRAGPLIRSGDGQLRQTRIRIDLPGQVRFRIVQRSGGRLNIDDVRITPYDKNSDHSPVLRLTCHNEVVANKDTVLYKPSNADLRQVVLRFENNGSRLLTVSSIQAVGAVAFLSPPAPFSLEPSGKTNVVVKEQTPSSFGSALTLRIFTNDPSHPVIHIVVIWQAVSSAELLPLKLARRRDSGTYVTVAGIASWNHKNEHRIYFQDESAGMAWMHKPFHDWEILQSVGDIQNGDSLYLTGRLATFNGVRHIVTSDNDPFTTFIIKTNEHITVPARNVSAEDLNLTAFQSELVMLKNLHFLQGGYFSAGSVHEIRSKTGVVRIIIPEISGLEHIPVPDTHVHVSGIAGLFAGEPVVYLRSADDLEPAGAAPTITSAPPWQTHATASTVTLEWTSRSTAHSIVWYGLTEELELGMSSSNKPNSTHYKTLENLLPATVYHMRIGVALGGDTLRSPVFLVSTGSPEGSTGEIRVHFNGVAAMSANGSHEHGQIDLLQILLNRIAQARYSIDMALYSIGGHPGERIAEKLANARARGVCIRIITDYEAGTGSFTEALEQFGITHINSRFGAKNSKRAGIHHNKYMVFDYRGSDVSGVWIATGSWNPTDAGTNRHYQNLVEIQDVALAGAYTLEFNQKWGSDTPVPDTGKSRFGEKKKRVAPELFWPGGRAMRLFFSPQVPTEEYILRYLSSANKNIHFASMLVTRSAYLHTLEERHKHGVVIQGLVGQPNQTGSIFPELARIDGVLAHDARRYGLLHHKYALVDATPSSQTGSVLTGSMNWTRAAYLHNDENILIIDCPEISAAYLAEFQERYSQALTALTVDHTIAPSSLLRTASVLENLKNRPNPFAGQTEIVFELNTSARVSLTVYDINGRLVRYLLHNRLLAPGTHYKIFDASQLGSGVYLYRITADRNAVKTGAMLHMR